MSRRIAIESGVWDGAGDPLTEWHADSAAIMRTVAGKERRVMREK
jgi:hypothetical protein